MERRRMRREQVEIWRADDAGIGKGRGWEERMGDGVLEGEEKK